MIELNKPAIRGTTDSEKIEEIRKYLFALIDDLQIVIEDLEKRMNALNKTDSFVFQNTNEISE